MKNYLTKFITISLIPFLSCNSLKKNQSNSSVVSDTNNLTSQELEYIKTRNNYIEHFKSLYKPGTTFNDSISKRDVSALLDLQKRLRDILKNSHFSTKGRINLETLFDGLGFGMLDGLTFQKDSSTRIFYTSKNLLSAYYNQKGKWSNELTSEDLELISYSAFISDAFLENFSSIRINSSENIRVLGMVGIAGQQTGPFLADRFYVFVAKGNYVYMAEKYFKEGLVKEIPECKLLWDSLDLEGKKKLEALKSQGEVPFQKQLEIEDDVFDKYCACYQKELKNEKQFESIKKEMELIAAYLEKKE